MTNDMTKGSPIRLILAFSIPLFIGNVFQQFYSMADTVIVGRTIGVPLTKELEDVKAFVMGL